LGFPEIQELSTSPISVGSEITTASQLREWIRDQAIDKFFTKLKGSLGEGADWAVGNYQKATLSMLGLSGIVLGGAPSGVYVDDDKCICDFSKTKLAFMAWTVALVEEAAQEPYGWYKNGSLQPQTVHGPALTQDHEAWHTNGPIARPAQVIRQLMKSGQIPNRQGYVKGAGLILGEVNRFLSASSKYPKDHPEARNDDWCQTQAKKAVDFFLAQMNWILNNGYWHDPENKLLNTEAIPPQPKLPPPGQVPRMPSPGDWNYEAP
jgi:hypothetical protein